MGSESKIPAMGRWLGVAVAILLAAACVTLWLAQSRDVLVSRICGSLTGFIVTTVAWALLFQAQILRRRISLFAIFVLLAMQSLFFAAYIRSDAF
jgi:hypothetical protein